MGILTWIVLGLISGAIAKGLMPGRESGGFVVTALLGIVVTAAVAWSASQAARLMPCILACDAASTDAGCKLTR